jgi:Uma2 family endonuclease
LGKGGFEVNLKRYLIFCIFENKTKNIMESIVFDEIEEFQTEDIMSYNHAKITYRLAKSLSRYDEQYDILPELEFELSHGRAKPDVAICRLGKIDWLRDIIRPTHPPLLAIEILSPRQALSDLTDKALDIYFPSGTTVVWIIVPHFRHVTVMTPNAQNTITSGVLLDENTGIEINLNSIFG